MKINSISSSSSVSYATQRETNSNFASVFMYSTNQTLENGTESKYNQETFTNTNVRAATFEEIVELSKALHAAGKISFKEVATLTFDYERATRYIKENAPSTVAANFSMFETAANDKGQRDWIAEFEARAKKDLQYGNLIAHQNKQKIVEILKKLEQ